ncbi:MAG: NUDIX domain-containing protein [Defluviitaleaceae bacterium]|nr:NUDIX domain-containing protein [Defluviitaleaceae bacterium]
MIKEWYFSEGNQLCHFRVAGLLIRNNKLFVQKDNNVCALPGGHVDFGETSAVTLAREFKEEIGVDIIVNRLVWVEEHFWKWGEKNAHQIHFYHLVSLKNDDDISDDFNETMRDNKGITLQWLALDKLKSTEIYPEFLPEKIGNIGDGVEHFIRNKW